MKNNRLSLISACLTLIGTSQAAPLSTPDQPAESSALDTVVVRGGANKYERGRDRVYTRNRQSV